MVWAVIFVLTLACWAAIAVYLLMFAARVYLVIVQDTAVGIDRVEWPDEPIFDWLLTSVYFLVLSGLILLPAGLLSRVLAGSFLPRQNGLRYLLLGVPCWWLLFPIGILSSLSASSRWMLLSPRMILALVRQAPALIVFYFITGVLITFGAGLLYISLFGPIWYLLPIGVIVMAWIWMIHARLVGRIGWLVQRERPGPETKRPRKKRPRPLAMEEPPDSPRLAYVVVEEKAPPPPRPRYLDPEPDPYALAEMPDEPPVKPLPREIPKAEEARVEREIAMRLREPPNPPPAYPLWSGVFDFPFYVTSRKHFMGLVFWGAIAGIMFRTMLLLFPR